MSAESDPFESIQADLETLRAKLASMRTTSDDQSETVASVGAELHAIQARLEAKRLEREALLRRTTR